MTRHRGAPPPENPPHALPSGTVWPVVLASGVVFAAAGLITSPLLIAFGVLMVLVSLGGWVSELTKGSR